MRYYISIRYNNFKHIGKLRCRNIVITSNHFFLFVYDNSVIESFFSSFKREELYRVKYRSEYEFRTAINTYMEFYNESRSHKNNKYLSPNKKEAEFFQKQKEHDGFLY